MGFHILIWWPSPLILTTCIQLLWVYIQNGVVCTERAVTTSFFLFTGFKVTQRLRSKRCKDTDHGNSFSGWLFVGCGAFGGPCLTCFDTGFYDGLEIVSGTKKYSLVSLVELLICHLRTISIWPTNLSVNCCVSTQNSQKVFKRHFTCMFASLPHTLFWKATSIPSFHSNPNSNNHSRIGQILSTFNFHLEKWMALLTLKDLFWFILVFLVVHQPSPRIEDFKGACNLMKELHFLQPFSCWVNPGAWRFGSWWKLPPLWKLTNGTPENWWLVQMKCPFTMIPS